MTRTPAPDPSATEPDRGPPRCPPAEYSGHVQPAAATATAYRSHASVYDRRTEAFRHWREQLVALLPARPGDTVLDVGCGTGLCLPLLHDKVGPTGTIVGIDASEQMLQMAADRVATRGWDNVRLLEAPVERAPIDATADAALFCAVHDVLQSRAALNRVFQHLRPGAAVAAGGGKWPGPLLRPLRAWVTALHAPFIADFTGFDRPWRLLSEFVPGPAGPRTGLRRRIPGPGPLPIGNALTTGLVEATDARGGSLADSGPVSKRRSRTVRTPAVADVGRQTAGKVTAHTR